MSTRLILSYFIFIFLVLELFSQEKVIPETGKKLVQQPVLEKKQLEKFKSMKKTLKYGITKERVAILKKVKRLSENEASYFFNDLEYILTKSKNWRLQVNTLQIINALKLTNFEEQIIQLLDSSVQAVQTQVILSLQSIKSEKSASKLIKLLKEQDFSLNSNLTILIIQTLSELKTGNQASGFLLEQLQQSYNDRTIRNQILIYLSKVEIEDKQSLQPILVSLFQDENENTLTRGYSVYVLGKLKLRESIPLLKEFLEKINQSKDKNFVRKSHLLKVRIVSALSDMGDENLYSLLIDMAKDDDESVRARAIRALGQMDNLDEESKNLLKYKSENDPSGKIRKVAKKIVKKIEEKKISKTPLDKSNQTIPTQLKEDDNNAEEDFIENQDN